MTETQMEDAIQSSSLDLLSVRTSASKDTTTTTQEYVESLSVDFFEHVINNRKFDHPLIRHILPDFKADHDFVYAVDRQGLIERIKEVTQTYPSFHSEVLNVSVEADDRLGKATVWILQLIHGVSVGTRRESVGVLYWVRKDGDWYCTRLRGLRGVSAYMNSEGIYDMGSFRL